MGICLSRKKNNLFLDKLINKNIYFTITGNLYINIKIYFYTYIYFYKDFLHINNKKINKIINYYDIISWIYNSSTTSWIYFKITENEKLYLYKFYLYKCFYYKNTKNIVYNISKLIYNNINLKKI